MGKGAAHIEKVERVYQDVIKQLKTHVTTTTTTTLPPPPKLKLQTMTVVADLPGPINLYNFAKECDGGNMKPFYDFELFSAVKLSSFRPVCVNVFATGKMIMCGIKDLKCADNILSDILEIYNKL